VALALVGLDEQARGVDVFDIVRCHELEAADRAAPVVALDRDLRRLEGPAGLLERLDPVRQIARLPVGLRGLVVTPGPLEGIARAPVLARRLEHLGGAPELARALVEPSGLLPLLEIRVQRGCV
jgi:hypothetical protein